MAMTVEQLSSEVDALPESARLHLAEHILASIEPGRPSLSDEQQRVIVRRRVEEIQSGAVETIPGEEVFAELDRLLRK